MEVMATVGTRVTGEMEVDMGEVGGFSTRLNVASSDRTTGHGWPGWAEDAEFAFAVLKETMRDHAVATWGTWWEEESRREIFEQVSE
jgi:hypothetical protein